MSVRSSKELASRLRFDRFPRPDFFRKRYLLVGAATALAGLGLWLWMSLTGGHMQYNPGPVTQNHATFGARCESCHDPFQNVQNEACLSCHPSRDHSEFVVRDADCRECHVEHLGEAGMLDVDDRACVVCHGELETTRDAPPIARDVSSFAAHPQFAVLRDGASDGAAIRFNHEIHLTSDKVRQALPEGAASEQCAPYAKLECKTCHQVDETGMLMREVTFDRDCACCHQQDVQGPLGSITAPHRAPDVIRENLTAKLLVLGVGRANEIFSSRETSLPGVRDRGPIDESRSLGEYERTWLAKLEAQLYQPLDARAPLLENNKYCFLCHDAESPYVAGTVLPVLKPTRIAQRWLAHSEFGHAKHEMVRCEDCHAAVRSSSKTSDVNLPPKELCAKCHTEDAASSAGARCALCHLYHDTSRDPAQRAAAQRTIPVAVLLGEELPERGLQIPPGPTPSLPAAGEGAAAAE
ncbi:MAG: hypothetical protein FJ148_08965 [Deltaproteobacteria bacterium]|nr:hypothetical protein [Deltaproteobacteria bacterium]